METATALKSFYDEWLNTQKQFTKNWIDSANSFQQQLTGTTQDQQQQAQQSYKQLTEQQQQMYRTWTDLMGRMQQAVGMQQFMGANGGSAAFPAFSIPTDANQWREQVEQQMKSAWNLWNPQANPLQSAFNAFQPFQQFQNLRSDTASRAFALYDTWNNLAGSWQQAVQRNQQQLADAMNSPAYKNLLNSTLSSTDTYLKVLEFWQPIYKKMQDKTLTYEQFQQMVSPERYKEVMDRMFEFASPESLQEFYNHTSRVTESLSGTAQNTIKRYNELMQRNTQLLPELMAGDPQAAMKLYESMYEAYQKNVDPAIKSLTGGRDAEVAGVMKEVGQQFAEYGQTLAKYQYRVYVTGQKAMENVAKEYYETFEKTGEAKSFTDFYKTWSDANQHAFQEVFRTEEFNQLQHDLSTIGQNVKGQLGKVVEVFLADYPVVPRSEMEAVHQTVHELKAQVASLQAALNSKGAPAPAAQAAPATPAAPAPEAEAAAAARKSTVKR